MNKCHFLASWSQVVESQDPQFFLYNTNIYYAKIKEQACFEILKLNCVTSIINAQQFQFFS